MRRLLAFTLVLWVAAAPLETVTDSVPASATYRVYANHSTWMGDLKDVLYPKRLVDVVLPGTHDSGAYRLDDDFAPGTKLSTALRYVTDLCKYLNKDSPFNALYLLMIKGFCGGTVQTVRSWAISQTGNIYDQLVGGIRFLDLRVVHDIETNSWRTDHMLMGDSVEKITSDISMFMRQFTTEILIVQVSHYAGVYQRNQLDDLASIFETNLEGLLFRRRGGFDFTIGDMVSSNKRILLTGSRQRVFSNHVSFWSEEEVFEGFYANTDVLRVMEKHNHHQLKKFGGNGKLFQMFFTLTLQGIRDLELGLMSPARNPHSLRSLAAIANADFDRWIFQETKTLRMSNILMTDFFETTSLINTVKMLNQALDRCDDLPQFRSIGQCRSWRKNGNCTDYSQSCKLSCGICANTTAVEVVM